ncbi:MAG: PTS sugar transporter subunit IIA [Thiolinea sp.]
MDITTLLSTDRIIFEDEVSSMKKAFEQLSRLLHQGSPENQISADEIFDALTSREKLGSTALGNGIAIPHTCMEIPEPVAALLVTEEGIKMDSPDKKPVHFLLALLIPSQNSQVYKPLLKELAANINHKGLYQAMLEHRSPAQTLRHISSLFITDIAA